MTNPTAPTAASPTPIEPPARRKSPTRFITPALALVAALGIGLLGGVLIGQNTASATSAVGAPGQGGFPGDGDGTGSAPGGAAGGFTTGTVAAVDGSTVTLELADGPTVKVTTTDDTTVTTTDEAAVDDLAEGDSLTVTGEADADGNVAATSITEGAGFGGRGGATPPNDDTTAG
jgi:hypothetical protein